MPGLGAVTAATIINPTTFGNAVVNAINSIIPNGYVSAVRARRSAAVSVPTSTNTVISWDTEDYDTDAFHSTSVNTSRLTVPTGLGGLYSIGYYFDVGAGTGVVAAWITVNGGSGRFAYQQVMNGATNGPLMNGSDFVGLNAGDYVELNVFHNAGSAVNMAGTAASFHMYRLGPKA